MLVHGAWLGCDLQFQFIGFLQRSYSVFTRFHVHNHLCYINNYYVIVVYDVTAESYINVEVLIML